MSKSRIVIVDALRGFALLGIVLIHFVEHFDFFHTPDVNWFFSPETDKLVMEMMFILISGKAYSIFALMFGLSFFIQMDRQQEKGVNFSMRFLWRLGVLFIFGFVHSLFYEGDILHIYALLGLPLVFINKLKIKQLLLLSVVLAMQIPTIYQLIASFINPEYEYTESFGSGFWGEATQVFASGNLYDVISFNILKGRMAVWGWTFYNGRYLQLLALFIIGLVMGRKRLFENLEENKNLFVKALLISILSALGIFIFRIGIGYTILTETQSYFLNKLASSYNALAFTSIIVFTFILLYLYAKEWKIFELLAVYGRMSLSNYVFQAMIGVSFFYNFGLGMYRYLGSTWSLIIGILFFTIQVIISKGWFNFFYYGPLEWLWRALTFFDYNIKFRRTRQALVHNENS